MSILKEINEPLLISALFFLSLCLLFWGIFKIVQRFLYKTHLLKKVKGTDTNGVILNRDGTSASGTSLKESFLYYSGQIGQIFAPKDVGDYSAWKLRFLRAGLHGENTFYGFYGIKIFLCVLVPFLFYFTKTIGLRTQIVVQPAVNLLITIALALIGFLLPNMWLIIKTARRRRRLRNGLPDALDLLVVCVEAGMGLDQAMKRTGEEISLSNKELSDELHLFNLELQMGKARKDALRNLAARTGVQELRNLVSVLIQTDKFGTSLASALRVSADSFRKERFQKAEEQAAKMALKMTFPLIFFIFPSLFAAILGPALIQFFYTFTNR